MTIGELKAAIDATGLPDDAVVDVEHVDDVFDITNVTAKEHGHRLRLRLWLSDDSRCPDCNKFEKDCYCYCDDDEDNEEETE